jgi:hypothetical protein
MTRAAAKAAPRPLALQHPPHDRLCWAQPKDSDVCCGIEVSGLGFHSLDMFNVLLHDVCGRTCSLRLSTAWHKVSCPCMRCESRPAAHLHQWRPSGQAAPAQSHPSTRRSTENAQWRSTRRCRLAAPECRHAFKAPQRWCTAAHHGATTVSSTRYVASLLAYPGCACTFAKPTMKSTCLSTISFERSPRSAGSGRCASMLSAMCDTLLHARRKRVRVTTTCPAVVRLDCAQHWSLQTGTSTQQTGDLDNHLADAAACSGAM